ncbi:MAG: hypothetical protein ACM3X3_07900 [Betaproteobacteria bacterium]
MKRQVWKWWKAVMVGIFVLVLAFALPAWASGSVGAPGTGSPALRADGGSTGPGGPGDDDDDQGGGDGAGNGGQDGNYDGGHDDDGHDDGNGAGNGHDDGQNDSGDGAGSGAGYDDSNNDTTDINNNDNNNDNNNNNDHEDSSDGPDMAGYARSLGLSEGFAARVAYQATRAGVDKEKLAATLRVMAELVQQGYFPDLAQAADGPVDHDASSAPVFDELDESTQARLGETLAEVVRTRDREWIREKLMACAMAGMTAIEAIEALASE